MAKPRGKRENAGRPAGQGKYGEPTKSIRIFLSQETTTRSFLEAFEKRKVIHEDNLSNVEERLVPRIGDESIRLPLYLTKVAAGLPSSPDDHIENTLDINEFMIDRKDSTFFIRIKGESMIDQNRPSLVISYWPW